ncbi:MAG: hypothetical protein R2911_29205 [Caldilineaceae bacterium]
MSTTLNGSRWLRWGLLVLLFAAVFATVLLWRFGAAALTGNQMSRAAPLAKNLTPDELFVQLFPAATLEEAANGFAGALGIPPQSVMVRLRFSGCEACAAKEDGPVPDLTVAAAAAEIERADAFWLVYNDLICFHLLQNGTWMPKSCAVFLSPGRG